MNRNTYQITEDILDTLLLSDHDGVKPTLLLRQSNLSYNRFNGFISKLTQSNLINEITVKNKKTYIITERGRLYLDEYKKFNNIAESFGLEL